MRLVELHLLAFGPFTDVSLVFSDQPGFHLIYGPNEAGKSTALRAITGLLYGIPVATGDAHLHRTTDLRIGARLANDHRTLLLMRRKGNKNTLLDAEGAALPDEVLDEFLGGIDEATFRAMFGLDHESLRRGAEALLRGRGSVGESLFDAGVGGRGIQALLEEMTLEADSLYRPRGQTQKINEALRELREAQKLRAGAELSADAWQKQLDAIEADRAEREELVAKQRLLAAEENSLRRGLRVRPLVAQLREAREQRAALGEVVRLAADARERRLDAQRVADECERQAERLRAEIAKRMADAQAIAVPEELAGLDESFVDELRNRLGEQRKAAEDLPKRQVELDLLRGDVSALIRRLGGGVEQKLGGEPLPVGLEKRIQALANERSGVRAALDSARRHLAERESRMRLLREELAGSDPPADVRALRRALSAAEQVTDEPVRVAKLRRRWERECEEIGRDAAALGLLRSGVAELRALVLPAPELLERVATRLQSAERQCAEGEERTRDLEARERENQRGRVALENLGAVPSEESLDDARRERERRWSGLRARVRSGAAEEDELRAYEVSVRTADELADRLRREAGRVESRARLVAEAEALRGERDALRRRMEELEAEQEAALLEWKGLWSELTTDVGPPAQMRGWLRRSEELLARVRRAEEMRGQIDEAESLLRERSAALRSELSSVGADEATADGDLAALIASASAVVERVAEASRREEENRRVLDDLRQQAEASRRDVAEGEAKLREWEAAWRESVAALALDAKATPEEAQAVLQELTTLHSRHDEMRRMEKRVSALAGDAERFAADVAGYVRAWAPELLAGSPLEMADHFLRRQRKAVADLRQREQIRREIEERKTALREQEERLGAAQRDLDVLLGQAGAADLQGLEECERRSGDASALEHRIADLEEKLLSVGEGASLEELVEQAGTIDPDTASARLREVEVELQELAERQRVLDNQIGGSLTGLDYMRRERGAADAAAEVEERVAALDEYVHRYVRVKLAIAMLEREIERYRQENQDPVLRRAGELFPRLTLGRYTALRVGYDNKDEAVLRCVRGDGAEVDVEGLSDGTRDQLYLALRLATLEKFAENNEAMPLVLDDILIHFDDDRARAAFEVLGEFATKCQVLFFTHNAHLVDLAREVMQSDRLTEHLLLEGECSRPFV